jgi:RimJ/RimL family protein N-acetyltransferase
VGAHPRRRPPAVPGAPAGVGPAIGPAYRIETERLVVRCWDPVDAAALKEAVDASVEHLRPWMPWAHDEPQTLAEKGELLRGFRGRFDLGDDFAYAIFDRGEERVLGGTGLHPRVAGAAREIGYWIRPDAEGRGLVTEAVGALTRVGFEVDRLDRIEIHCDPANERSAAVARRLGYTHEATLRRRLDDGRGGVRDVEIWTLFADAYSRSPAAALTIAAHDAAGTRVL